MTIRFAAPVLATAMLLAGCAASSDGYSEPRLAGTGDREDCFFLSQVNGYTDAGRDRINVNVGPGRTYEFKTFGSCPQLDYSSAIGFDKRGPGTICRGMDVDLIVPTSIGPQRCPVSMIRRLPPKP
jgi:hypothetical protein